MNFEHKAVVLLILILGQSITIVFASSIYEKDLLIQNNSLTEAQKSDLNDFQTFMLKLDEVTKIATKTKLNADYVPGIITVMNRDELLIKGCNKVIDAINIAPGFTKTGTTITVRGIGDVIHSGKLKYLVNNVPMNENLSGVFNSILHIPIEQIERIEIIRGPGATLHGKFAYAGVINIITRNTGNSIILGCGENKTRYDGIILSYKSPKDNYGINLNFSGMNNDRTGRLAGPDILYGTPNQHISLAPGEIDDSSESYLATLSMHYEDFSIIGQYVSYIFGSGFGFLSALPPLDESRKDVVSGYTIQANWQPSLSNDVNLNIFTGFTSHYYDESDAYFYPPGFAMPTGISYTDGVIAGPHYEEMCINTGIEFNYEGIDKHTLLIGLMHEHNKTSDVWAGRNYELLPGTGGIPGEPLPSLRRFSGDGNWLEENIKRNILSIYIQDYFNIFDQISITAGIRYDRYNDVGENISPRLSGVYNLFDQHIIKVQYAEAFRPPSFLEMYSKNNPTSQGNKDIKPETIKTFELAYFFKGKRFNAKTTLYYSELEDLIVQKDITYLNTERARAKGAEFELKWNLYNNLSIDANCAFSKTNRSSTNQELEGSMRWLGNAGIIYNFLNQFYFSLQYRYVDDRKRSPEDSRGDIDSYHCFNFSTLMENVFNNKVNLRFNVHNIFDHDIRYPSFGYKEDYPEVARTWMIYVSKNF